MSQDQAVIDAVACPHCKRGQKQPCVYRTGPCERIGMRTKECHPERKSLMIRDAPLVDWDWSSAAARRERERVLHYLRVILQTNEEMENAYEGSHPAVLGAAGAVGTLLARLIEGIENGAHVD